MTDRDVWDRLRHQVRTGEGAWWRRPASTVVRTPEERDRLALQWQATVLRAIENGPRGPVTCMPKEASRLTGVPYTTIRYWMSRGYADRKGPEVYLHSVLHLMRNPPMRCRRVVSNTGTAVLAMYARRAS